MAIFSILFQLVLLADPITTISNVCQVKNLSISDFSRAIPFCLTGQITGESPVGYNFCTSDGAWPLRGTNVNLKVGQIVRAAGYSELGSFANDPFLRLTNAVILGSAPLPEPKLLSAEEILTGKESFSCIRVRGFLVDAFEDDIDWACVIALLNVDGHIFHTSTVKSENALNRLRALVDADIEITGICSPFIGGQRRFSIPSISFGSVDKDIRVIKPPANDPFDAPKLENLIRAQTSRIALMKRRTVHGRVLAAWEGRHLLLSHDNGQIARLDLADGEVSANAGDWIDAVGFPETDFFNINLTNVRIRPAQPQKAEPDAPVVLSARTVGPPDVPGRFNYDYHGKVLRLSGIVRSIPGPGQKFSCMTIEDDGVLVPINPGNNPNAFFNVQIGSQVEVSGICVMEISNWHPQSNFPTVTGFSVIIRDPGDIRILSRPSWWTPGRIWAVVGLMTAALLAFFVWNTSLRRLAERRGRELLRGQIESVTDKLKVEERTRLAVELHDSLSQTLTGVSMEIAAAEDLRGEAPKPMLAHLGIAAKTLKSCRDELRNCLWDLRSQALEEKDMTTAIRRTLQPQVNDANLAVRFNVPRARLSDNTAHALLRIIRELAVNAIRHGEATTVKIAGTIDGDRLLGSVTDNGKGFDPDNAPGVPQGHFGLQGIRERIDDLGGTFTVESAPGKGTKATFVLMCTHPHGSGGSFQRGTLL